jgi:hypothetical protein
MLNKIKAIFKRKVKVTITPEMIAEVKAQMSVIKKNLRAKNSKNEIIDMAMALYSENVDLKAKLGIK